MAVTYLDDIVAFHRARVARDSRDWRQRLEAVRHTGPSLTDALTADPATVAVIGEVKRRSPSQGWIAEDLVPAELALAYERGGARAVSVLTDAEFFAGSPTDLRQVRENVAVPVLQKDFTLSANDVVDAAVLGAAVLLIVAALSDDELALFMDVARQCAIDSLVEVHDTVEARRALDVGARVIGVNQRDLRTFGVDETRAVAVIATLPGDVVAVAESGLRTVTDVQRVADAGYDAILVGETLVRASDPVELVRQFASVRRTSRA